MTEMILNEVASTGHRAPRIVRGHRRDTQTKLIEKASWEDFRRQPWEVLKHSRVRAGANCYVLYHPAVLLRVL